MAWMAIIFAFSSQPDSDPSGRRLHIDLYKVAHLTEFGILGVLVAGATRNLNAPRAGWWAWVIVVLYAISDEIHQALVPGRSPLVTDVAIDALGGLLGIFALLPPTHVRESRLLPSAIARLLGRRPSASHARAMYADGSGEDRR